MGPMPEVAFTRINYLMCVPSLSRDPFLTCNHNFYRVS